MPQSEETKSYGPDYTPEQSKWERTTYCKYRAKSVIEFNDGRHALLSFSYGDSVTNSCESEKLFLRSNA